MIGVKLRDFRGCERADIDCAPIALVAGRNAAGKSSLAQAVGAALTGKALMLEGVTKAMAGQLVHAGAAEAHAEISAEAGTSRIAWPACEMAQSGDPPKSSIWAAGLDSVALLAPRERAQILAEYLHADPTREDLAAALADAGFGEERAAVTALVWQLIEAQGWDSAHQKRRETGAELKGRWSAITGRNWGARLAQTWTPAGWSADLEDKSENDLAAARDVAKAAHEEAIGAAAVSSAERQRLEAEAGRLEAHKDTLANAEIEETRLETELEKLQAARAALPPGGAEAEMPCPHCGGLVVLRQVDLATRRLEMAQAVPADELKRRRLAIAETDGALGRVQGQLGEQRRAVERARTAMQLAADAQYRLGKMPAGAPANVAGAAEKLARAEHRLAAWRAKRQADDLRDRVNGNDLVLKILAPDGLRAKKLARVLDAFNRTLVPLTDAAEWVAVTVDAAQGSVMSLAYGGRPYALCSTSEQYRVRAVLQCAMARLDGSGMVVLDAADVLDGPTRSGLFALLEESGLAALVCLTLSRPSQCPDLAKAGLGNSYWLEAGIAHPLQQPAEAAA